MAKKVKETPKKEIPLEVYKVANLVSKCYACGHEHVVEENITGGIKFELYATNKHKLALACPNCKAVIALYFTKVEEPLLVDMDGAPVKAPKPLPIEDIPSAPLDTPEADPCLPEEDFPEMPEVELPEEVKSEIERINNESAVQEESKQETLA